MKLSNDKKGVELTFNTIVIIVLVLLVLVILAFILIKGFGTATTTMQCESNGGKCAPKCGEGQATGYNYVKPWSCKAGELCCAQDLLK